MRTTLSILTICVSAIAISHQASAATVVLGLNTYAQACYDAAIAGDTKQVISCDLALKEPLMPHDRAATFINRSALRILSGDQKGGLADCDASISAYDGLGEAYLNRGVALRALGNSREAIVALDKGIEIGLKRPQLAYYDRAMAKEDVGDVAGAYHDYKMAVELAPAFTLASDQLKRFKVTEMPDSKA